MTFPEDEIRSHSRTGQHLSLQNFIPVFEIPAEKSLGRKVAEMEHLFSGVWLAGEI